MSAVVRWIRRLNKCRNQSCEGYSNFHKIYRATTECKQRCYSLSAFVFLTMLVAGIDVSDDGAIRYWKIVTVD
jgi:hypothetical protein